MSEQGAFVFSTRMVRPSVFPSSTTEFSVYVLCDLAPMQSRFCLAHRLMLDFGVNGSDDGPVFSVDQK